MDDQFIIVAKIVNTHGNKGLVKIMPITDFPERFIDKEQLFVDLDGQLKTLNIVEARPHKSFILLGFKEIDDMNAAQQLKGKYLKIQRHQLKKLPQNNYYIFQIVGLSVYDTEGNYLGVVQEVLQTGSNDVYVVQQPNDLPACEQKAEGVAKEAVKPVLIPALKEVVLNIDLDQQTMTIKMPEGLLD